MKDITPEGSIVPVYLDPTPKDQVDQDAAALIEKQAEAEAKIAQKAALLERLGISADEAALLVG